VLVRLDNVVGPHRKRGLAPNGMAKPWGTNPLQLMMNPRGRLTELFSRAMAHESWHEQHHNHGRQQPKLGRPQDCVAAQGKLRRSQESVATVCPRSSGLSMCSGDAVVSCRYNRNSQHRSASESPIRFAHSALNTSRYIRSIELQSLLNPARVIVASYQH
jgi:hypothetical protein